MEIKDDKDRVLVHIIDGKVLVNRYVDLDDEIKSTIVELFKKLTGEDGKRVKDFLNFESDESEFCS